MPRSDKSLYLLPLPISDNNGDLPKDTLEAFRACTAFVCERVRTFRRWVKHLDHPLAIDDMTLVEMEKHDPGANVPQLDQLMRKHDRIGIVSEAGCPGIADPGFRYAAWAHRHNIRVRAFTGPNSLMLALMNSGFSGQNFAFHGYLSARKGELATDLERLEKDSRHHGRAQIFIEAPYRNRQVVEVALSTLSPDTLLHISVDLHADTEWCLTKTVGEWKKMKLPDLHKRPAVFVVKG